MKYNYVFITHIVTYPTNINLNKSVNPDQSITLVTHLNSGYEIYQSYPIVTENTGAIVFILRKQIEG